MKNTFGNCLEITIFGESHGEAIGAVLDGVPSGLEVNREFIKAMLALRRPQADISTPRCEADEFRILSGVFCDKTTGTPICIMIPNKDTKSGDYEDIRKLPRPSHADYTAHMRYDGFEDYRGGGHQSGRITAAIVAAAAIIIPALEKKGIFIGSHIKKYGSVCDRDFGDYSSDIKALNASYFATLDASVKEKMIEEIKEAKSEGDSIGGIIETAVIGMPAGVGEPWFDSLEGMISHAVFSVPAVKGIEFGKGFGLADMRGSEANDEFVFENGEIGTKSNNNGGILGGISSGMPIVFRTAIKPTPTISKPQATVNLETNENVELCARGRHDPAIAHRARIVIDSVTAIAVADMLISRFGSGWLR